MNEFTHGKKQTEHTVNEGTKKKKGCFWGFIWRAKYQHNPRTIESKRHFHGLRSCNGLIVFVERLPDTKSETHKLASLHDPAR
jgi:hypothetical protein